MDEAARRSRAILLAQPRGDIRRGVRDDDRRRRRARCRSGSRASRAGGRASRDRPPRRSSRTRPDTWYAAIGTSQRARASATRSSCGPAGLTITMSAPSSMSSAISRIASRRFADPSGSRADRRTRARCRRPPGRARRRLRHAFAAYAIIAVSPKSRCIEAGADRTRPGRPSLRSARRCPRRPAPATTPSGPMSARVASLSTPPSAISGPQWPWLVYSQRHVSAISASGRSASRSRESACCTTPSSIHAPVPQCVLVVRQAEDDHAAQTQPGVAFRIAHGLVGRDVVDPRERRDRPPQSAAGADEDRGHEHLGMEACLADEIAQRAGPAPSARASGRSVVECRRVPVGGGSSIVFKG